jgi:hypothetical protein
MWKTDVISNVLVPLLGYDSYEEYIDALDYGYNVSTHRKLRRKILALFQEEK